MFSVSGGDEFEYDAGGENSCLEHINPASFCTQVIKHLTMRAGVGLKLIVRKQELAINRTCLHVLIMPWRWFVQYIL